MALHKSQAQFARAQWRIKLLAPIWASQLLLTMTMMGLFAWRFGNTMQHHDDKVKAGKKPTIEYAWEATNIAMSLVASLCTFVDIARYYTESLTPWTMLFTHVIKATCAFAILALDVAVYITLSEEKYSLIGIGLDSLLILLTGATTIYAFLAYRRLAAYDDYAHPANVKGYGFNDLSTSSNISHLPANKRNSLRSVRLSTRSVNESVSMDVLDTTPYHHQRDTQYDEYRAKRNSFNAPRETLAGVGDAARNPQRYSPPDSSPKTLSPLLSPSIATNQVKALQRGLARPRTTSWASDHMLVAVPEEEIEAGHGNGDEVSLLSPDSNEMPGFDGPRVVQDTDIPERSRKDM
ncbi:hypothetical protein BB8028_0009g01650 [Beauveria bassiana]|uniref:Uncharacterized protein n=1 Tax=Beauveria bassiana TaxID=176275 RepID=A0A2S7YPI6_BEABA|nr:hypothetical protein BB8028_0009g01650 [Beauveria bassiana]